MNESPGLTVFNIIKLKPGISKLNYYAVFIHNIIMGFFLNGFELLQQDILADPKYYNLPADVAIETNANIILFDIIVRIVAFSIYGILTDKFGRKKVLITGIFIITTGILLFPIRGYFHDLDSIFPWYYIARFIYANGAAMVIVMPFIADYIEDRSKGKASGINAIFLAIGFLLSTSVIRSLYSHNLDLKFVYLISGLIVFCFGILYSLFIKGGSTYYHVSQQVDNTSQNSESKKEVKVTLKYVMNSIKQRPWIQASFIFALLTGGNMAIVSQILSLFVRSLGNNTTKDIGSQIVQYSNYGGIMTTITLGVLFDYFPPFNIVASMLLISLFGYNFVWLVNGPHDAFLIVLGVFTGISYSTSQLSMNYLGFTNYPKLLRGRLYGVANLITCLGNLIITVIGGNLVKYLSNYIQFELIIGCTAVSLITLVALYIKSIRKWDMNRKKVESEESYQSLLQDNDSKDKILINT